MSKETKSSGIDQKAPVHPATVDAQIRELETQHDLFRYEIDGWCAWPLLRFAVAREVANIPLTNRHSMGWAERLVTAVQTVTDLLRLRRERYVVKTYSSARAEREGELYKDLYFDDLLLSIGSYFKIESINSSRFAYTDRSALLKANLRTMMFELMGHTLARVRHPRHIRHIADSLSAQIVDELGLQMFSPQRIARALSYFCSLKRFYAWVLGRVEPEYLFVADPGEFSIVAAAKELGIKVIEFQHGAIDRHHPAYSWPEHALDFKPRMPIADLLFLYGEHWKQELAANGFWHDELRPVGSMRIDQYRRARTASLENERCTILVTTQGIDVDRVVAFISEFLRIARGQLDLRLYIKLHPVYETNKEPYLAASPMGDNVYVLSGDEQPSTFELLTRAHLHVTISSTTHYEALGLGVPTVILPFATHEIVLPLYRARHALLARAPQDLLHLALQWKTLAVPASLGEQYFKTGALENIKRELGI